MQVKTVLEYSAAYFYEFKTWVKPPFPFLTCIITLGKGTCINDVRFLGGWGVKQNRDKVGQGR